jgi:hypothetical protein
MMAFKLLYRPKIFKYDNKITLSGASRGNINDEIRIKK